MLILTINPGSTSSKIGIFENEKLLVEETIRHETSVIEKFDSIISQRDFRKELILSFLEKNNYKIDRFDAIVGRGGLTRPVSGGTYLVDKIMIDELSSAEYGEHASNLGAILAFDIASGNCPAYVVDPVVVDELKEISRVTGHPLIKKTSVFHALNQKAIAHRYANEHDLNYEDLNLIVVHLGGGISVGLHEKGAVVDVNNALNGEGPISPERSGGLIAERLVELCFSEKYSKKQIIEMIRGKGGLVAYTSKNSMIDLVEEAKTNKETKLLIDAMSYQTSKEITSLAAALNGEIDAILLTGGIAYSEMVVNEIKKRVSFLAKVFVYPGEDELLALAKGALRVLKKEEEAKEFPS